MFFVPWWNGGFVVESNNGTVVYDPGDATCYLGKFREEYRVPFGQALAAMVFGIIRKDNERNTFGCRHGDIACVLGFDGKALEQTLCHLVHQGFVLMKLCQTNTGGTLEWFYTAVNGIEVVLPTGSITKPANG